jgi:hypothetical protein
MLAAVAAAAFVLVRRRRAGAQDQTAALPGLHASGGAPSQPWLQVPPAFDDIKFELPATMPEGSAMTAAAASALPGTYSASRSTSRALASDPLMSYIQSSLLPITSANSGLSGAPSTPAAAAGLAPWRLRFADLVIERPIGEGSWGRVYKASWNSTPVAVKVLMADTGGAASNASVGASGAVSQVPADGGRMAARLAAEAALMTQLHHPNVVHLLGMTDTPAALVMEFCARGSLLSVLRGGAASASRAAELTWARRLAMAGDCVRGMLYLHTRSPPILHRDLKSPNLLVDDGWRVKVCDFNLSKLMEESARSASLHALNPRWAAPEVLNGEPAGMEADVFAFGVVLWELLTWELPWGTANPWGIVRAVTGGGRLPVPPPAELPGPGSGAWPQLGRYLELMGRCWAQEAPARPTFQEVMAELAALAEGAP